jgi:hypothetical protein
MRAINFPESNSFYSREGCDDLHTFTSVTDGVVISCWEVSEEDLARIQDTGRIWLYFHGGLVPPVSLVTEYPFPPPAEVEFPESIESGEEIEP